MAQIAQNTWENPSLLREFKPTVFVFCFLYITQTEWETFMESKWVYRTGQAMAQRRRKSPFDTDNVEHLLPALYSCTSLESHSDTVCSMYVSPHTVVVSAGRQCSSSKRFSAAAPCRKLNDPQQNMKTDIPACNRTIQSNKGLTGAPLEGWEREREYISAAQCLPSSNKHALSCPYCVRSPQSTM